jgi:hypothetical protein
VPEGPRNTTFSVRSTDAPRKKIIEPASRAFIERSLLAKAGRSDFEVLAPHRLDQSLDESIIVARLGSFCHNGMEEDDVICTW